MVDYSSVVVVDWIVNDCDLVDSFVDQKINCDYERNERFIEEFTYKMDNVAAEQLMLLVDIAVVAVNVALSDKGLYFFNIRSRFLRGWY